MCPLHTQPLSPPTAGIPVYPEHMDQHTQLTASCAVCLSPFAITPTLLPVSVSLCDTMMAMWQQLLSPVLTGTLAMLDSILTYSKQTKRDAKEGTKPYSMSTDLILSAPLWKKRSRKSVLPVLWLSLGVFGAELLSPALTSSCLGRVVALGSAPSYCLSPAQTSQSTGLSWELQECLLQPETMELLIPVPGNHL